MSPPASTISRTKSGSGVALYVSFFVLLVMMPASASTSSSSPSSILSVSAHSRSGSPVFIAFLKKMRANDLAIIYLTLAPLSARGACSLEEPHPKLSPVSYTHLRAHETRHDLVCRLLLEKK